MDTVTEKPHFVHKSDDGVFCLIMFTLTNIVHIGRVVLLFDAILLQNVSIKRKRMISDILMAL